MLQVTYTCFTIQSVFLKWINPSLGRKMLATWQLVPSSIVFIIISPEIVPPLQLTAPADCFRSERIHVDGWRNVDETGSRGDKAQCPLSAADLSAGTGLGGLGQQALQGWREATKYIHPWGLGFKAENRAVSSEVMADAPLVCWESRRAAASST